MRVLTIKDIFAPPSSFPSSHPLLTVWRKLHGASVSLALSTAIHHKDPLSVICIVVEDNLAMERLSTELRFFCSEKIRITIFPHWETLPYDHFSPYPDLITSRLTVLYQLDTHVIDVVIMTSTTLLQRLPPKHYLREHVFLLKVGELFCIKTWRDRLHSIGYHAETQVQEQGEYAIRGSLIDLFPTGSSHPLRIDLLDNVIDSIRTFSVETQRTIKEIETVRLLPAKEFPFSPESIEHFRVSWRGQFTGNPLDCSIYQDVSAGICPSGIEYYFPLFFEQTTTFFDYLPLETQMIYLTDLNTVLEKYWYEIDSCYTQNCHDRTRPLLEPKQLFMTSQECFHHFQQYPRIWIDLPSSETTQSRPIILNEQDKIEIKEDLVSINMFTTEAIRPFVIHHQAAQPLADLNHFIQPYSGRLLFCAESIGRQEMILQLLRNIGIYPIVYSSWQAFLQEETPYGMVIVALESGFCLLQPPLMVMTETEIYGKQRVMQRRLRKRTTLEVEEGGGIHLEEKLQVGDLVTHVQHGIGRYCGLKTLVAGEQRAEYLCIEYANEDKLYVPVHSLHLVARYSSATTVSPPLHQLGQQQWGRTTRKAIEKVHDVAAELLDLYAKRAMNTGQAYQIPPQEYAAFSAEFPFEETPDQLRAIDQVLEDMQSNKLMDRVICGEVGFGKTEVAMRAAFIAVQNHQQVAILVPTTLLAQQHYKNFQDRFVHWPIRIGILSRFNSSQERAQVLQQLHIGQLDILIGTHQLLQSQVKFKSLGLVIIDEEHRFGVKQKELFKAMRTAVDMLVMTATPIPRTLNMALSGMRDLSIIATPPARRLSVKTFLQTYQPSVIQEAIRREIIRGGQVYFVHNDIHTMPQQAEIIKQLVAEARLTIAHGQMPEKELESVMADFYHRRFNILLCSTIIESGIDVPTANTILINHADRFGLAQLHQLRGRVGRSHHQAYAYLFIPSHQSLTHEAAKRLEAISSLDTLGIGFTLATHDLEIRGAGELLGDKQSGEIKKLGFTLYMELLSQATAALKTGKKIDLEQALLYRNIEINLNMTALIPEDYLPDIPLRLIFYKRIANATSTEQLEDLQVELIDRFGLLPEALKNLIAISELRLKARKLGMIKIDANVKGGKFIFSEHPNIDPDRIKQLLMDDQYGFALYPPNGLRFSLPEHGVQQRISYVSERLSILC